MFFIMPAFCNGISVADCRCCISTLFALLCELSSCTHHLHLLYSSSWSKNNSLRNKNQGTAKVFRFILYSAESLSNASSIIRWFLFFNWFLFVLFWGFFVLFWVSGCLVLLLLLFFLYWWDLRPESFLTPKPAPLRN